MSVALKQTSLFQMFLLKSSKAYLCPNMIKFNGIHFSERRSEEDKFLLTLSVVGLFVAVTDRLIKAILEVWNADTNNSF